jgi:hypothetical protein
VGRVLVALLALVLTACAATATKPDTESEPPPSSRGSAKAQPTETAAAKPASPRVRFAKAVAALRRSDPLVSNYVLKDTHTAVISSFGSWNPEAGSASLRVFISKPLEPADQSIGGRLLVIGQVWYLQLQNRCWTRADRNFLADRYGLTDDTMGLTAAEALSEAQVTGVSLGSKDILEIGFDVNRVLAMSGLPDIDAEGRVPGLVTVLDGRVTKLTIDGADLAESLAQEVSPKRAEALSYLSLEMSFAQGPTDDIRRPPPDKLAPDSRTPCQAAQMAQA